MPDKLGPVLLPIVACGTGPVNGWTGGPHVFSASLCVGAACSSSVWSASGVWVLAVPAGCGVYRRVATALLQFADPTGEGQTNHHLFLAQSERRDIREPVTWTFMGFTLSRNAIGDLSC